MVIWMAMFLFLQIFKFLGNYFLISFQNNNNRLHQDWFHNLEEIWHIWVFFLFFQKQFFSCSLIFGQKNEQLDIMWFWQMLLSLYCTEKDMNLHNMAKLELSIGKFNYFFVFFDNFIELNFAWKNKWFLARTKKSTQCITRRSSWKSQYFQCCLVERSILLWWLSKRNEGYCWRQVFLSFSLIFISFQNLIHSFSKMWFRLPKFTPDQKELLLSARPDWVGFNPYTGRYVEMGKSVPRNQSKGSWEDMHVEWFDTDMNGKKIGEQAESDWIYVVPWSIRRWINWLDKRYEKTPSFFFEFFSVFCYYWSPLTFWTVYITENGCSAPKEDEKPLEEALNDTFRLNYLKSYIEEVYNARVIDKCNIQGYYVWSFLDNFEWNGGYKYRFGINYVDFKDPKLTRYQKASSLWYSKLVQTRCLDWKQ